MAGTYKVDFRQLGRTGARVSNLCLGAMNFGSRTEEKESVEIIHRFLDEGLNFIDTANVYSKGVSESFVGKAIKGRRDEVFLATKVHGRMGEKPNDQGNSRVHILKQVEESLSRLQTDYIDLYWIHRPDLNTPIDETLKTLDDLVRQGKVRYIGLSTFPAWQTMESIMISKQMNLEQFVAEQPPYNLFDRSVEEEVVPVCQKYGLGIMPWGPLAEGWLTGRYRKDQPFPQDTRVSRKNVDLNSGYIVDRLNAIEALMPIAQEKGITLSQLALAWLIQQPGVTAPIIGPRTMEQLDDNLGALNVELNQDDLDRIDAAIPPKSRVGGKRHWE
ncbi:aldo/keto reductase [Paenibacillus sepulcri]|uniref:Aldo/keto reductase n=1 Tax=Paenibacillus sepulcri TaxID=359917 RepID=A0ABS7C2R4_9BACL|nr:aldo/keto reductase [Paenibacillus sepulcri]